MTASTCRFCKKLIDQGVKYGPRHYAHFECYLDAGKRLDDLTKFQISQFPFRVIKDRGLLVHAELLVSSTSSVQRRFRKVVEALIEA
jgi:hypothetical protein